MRNSLRRTIRIALSHVHGGSHVRLQRDRAMQLCTLIVVVVVCDVVVALAWRSAFWGTPDEVERVELDGPRGIRKANAIVTRSRTSTNSVKYTLLSMPSARCSIHLRGKWNYKRIPVLVDFSVVADTSCTRVTRTNVESTVAGRRYVCAILICSVLVGIGSAKGFPATVDRDFQRV